MVSWSLAQALEQEDKPVIFATLTIETFATGVNLFRLIVQVMIDLSVCAVLCSVSILRARLAV